MLEHRTRGLQQQHMLNRHFFLERKFGIRYVEEEGSTQNIKTHNFCLTHRACLRQLFVAEIGYSTGLIYIRKRYQYND